MPLIRLYCICGISLIVRVAELVLKFISTPSINLSPIVIKKSRFLKFDSLLFGWYEDGTCFIN